MPPHYAAFDQLVNLAKGDKDLTPDEIAAGIDYRRLLLRAYREYYARIDMLNKHRLLQKLDRR
jgi:hypothetical protein